MAGAAGPLGRSPTERRAAGTVGGVERDREDAWAAPIPRAAADRLRALAVPVLLLLVAALGAHRSATLQQSSWKGASFGMFATYDGPSRSVRVTASGPEGPYRVSLPDSLRDDANRLRIVPTQGAAEAMARAVLDLGASEGVTAVRVEVVRVVLDADGPDLRASSETLVDVRAT